MRNNLGVALLGAREPAAAETVFRALVVARRRLLGDQHPEVAGALQNLAAALLAQGRYDEAEALTREAEALYRAVLPAGWLVVTFPMLTRSEIQLARGNFVGARRTAEAVRAALLGRLPPAHPAVLVADCRLGRALTGLGDTARARQLLDGVAAGMSPRKECARSIGPSAWRRWKRCGRWCVGARCRVEPMGGGARCGG